MEIPESLGATGDGTNEYKKPKLTQLRVPPVKDKSANPIQITAELILKDPNIHQMDNIELPTRRIMDEDELFEYKKGKRKEFENKLRGQKHLIGNWIRYANWEQNLGEFARARSIFERALNVDYQNTGLWLKYIEMEMKNKFINHARNLFERATQLLPRVDQFWFKYAYMEEMLGHYIKARNVFARWMTWKPSEQAFMVYVKFEERMGEKELARKVMYQYLDAHPKLDTYIKTAKYEHTNKHFEDARFIFGKSLTDLGDEACQERLFSSWAKFELSLREVDRARELYKFGLQNIPQEKCRKLYEEYLQFEKQHGTGNEVDRLVLEKRRGYYKGLLKDYPSNYDTWFDLIFLEQECKDVENVRDAFEQAIRNLPPANEKRLWRRYIFLWIAYAIYEELETKDYEKTREVFSRAIKLIPHKIFTFSKIWIMYAQFLVRIKDLAAARKVYGQAIGLCPREKIFRSYIQLEMQLTNFDRCRMIYGKYLETFPDKPQIWVDFAEMEGVLQEHERCRQIYQSAINLPVLNMPEIVWKAYIDFEMRLRNYKNVRALYTLLLSKTKHVKAWVSFARFEKEQSDYEAMRELYNDGDAFFKGKEELKEQRKMLLESWFEDEASIGDQQWMAQVEKKLPKMVVKQRKVFVENQVTGEQEQDGWEEYEEIVFQDDIQNFRIPKILKNAYNWENRFNKKLKMDTPAAPQQPPDEHQAASSTEATYDQQEDPQNNSKNTNLDGQKENDEEIYMDLDEQ